MAVREGSQRLAEIAADLQLAATTLARLTGHSDAGFTLRAYGRDAAGVINDMFARASGAGIGV